MSATQELAPPATPPVPEPKVNPPHAWAGRPVFYWQTVNATTGEIAARPATLLEPTRGVDGGWDLNFQRRGLVQGRQAVRFSERPKAGCFTFPPGPAKPTK